VSLTNCPTSYDGLVRFRPTCGPHCGSRIWKPKHLPPARPETARNVPLRPLVDAVPAALLTALVAAAAAQSAPTKRLKSRSSKRSSRRRADSGTAWSPRRPHRPSHQRLLGRQYRRVPVNCDGLRSDSYPVDPTLGQRWADFSPRSCTERSCPPWTVLLSDAAQIERICGTDAVACYSARGALLYARAKSSSSLSAEAGDRTRVWPSRRRNR